MKTKIFLLSAAVVAIGLFALPATVSMFAGQHAWYDPKDQGIPCEKCHWLEYEEMRGVTDETGHVPHMYKNGTTHYFDCEECHNVTMNIDYYHHTGDVGEHTPAHAATTLSCLDCHGGTLYGNLSMANDEFFDIPMHQLWQKYGLKNNHWMSCDKCHRDLPGRTFIENVDTELTNNRSAHKAFYLAMKDEETGLSDTNEACLGCHSRTGVNITWTRNSYVSYHVTCDKSGYNVSWNTSDNLGTNRTVFGSSPG
jgi:hypothetical protein